MLLYWMNACTFFDQCPKMNAKPTYYNGYSLRIQFPRMLAEYICRCFLHLGERSRHRRGDRTGEGKVEHRNEAKGALVRVGRS